MSNFMFVVPPFYGHITATMSVGGELIQRGHKVCWVSLRDINPGFIPEGGQWIVPEEVRARKAEVDRIMDRQNLGTTVTGTKTLDFVLEETQLPFADILNAGMQGVIDSFKPDVIIQDESAFSGAVAAVKNNIPYATSITVPPGYFEPYLFNPERQKILLDKMLVVQKEMGVQSDRVIFNSDKLVLSFTTPDLLKPHYKDFVFEAPIEYVGSSVEGRPEPNKFDWSQVKNPDWPILYVSIGTLLDDIRSVIFKRIIDAFDGQPLTIIANTDPLLFDHWPENFIVQKVCPQVEVLSKVDLVVTHAGFNTVNEALFFDLPMIALPLAWDQGVNADLIEIHGCGKKFKYRRMSPLMLREAVFEILQQPHYRESAARLGQSLRDKGGTKRAADLIEKLAS